VFKEIDYGQSGTGEMVKRLFAIDSQNPKVQSQIGSDMEGSGLGPNVFDCELSPDERWLWVSFYAGRHDVEPMLFRHVSGTKFEDITDSSGVQAELSKCYSYEETRIFGWKKDSSGVYLKLDTRGQANANYLDVLAFYNLITHDAAVVSPVFSIPTNADDALEASESAKESAQFHRIIRESAVEEPSIERNLNLIYTLLKRRLNSQEQQQLIAEENEWLATREKKPESEREGFTADRVQALAGRWLRVGTQSQLPGVP
jgi:hypothetical protein